MRKGPGARRAATAARALATVLSLVLLIGSGWGWYLGQVADASVNRTDAIPTDGNTGGGGSAMNLLLVGNDSRTTLSKELQSELHTGGDQGFNTDTMILVHVPADGSRASFVSFPRDSYVEIPGYGKDKLNAAYAYGRQNAPEGASEEEKSGQGAQLLVQTISGLTGLKIDHYAEVDLLGFFNLTEVVGGVEVNLCRAVDDRKYSGAVFPAGPQVISGADAVKFVRQRHGLPRVDLDRIVRQQVFIGGVLRKMLSEDVMLDLGRQRQLAEAASKALTVDRDLELLDLAQQMQSVTAGSIEFQTIPIVTPDGRDEDGRSIVQLEDQETLHAFFADLSAEPEKPGTPSTPTSEAPPTAAPSEVTVEVLNGSGTPGLAGTAAEALTAAGYVVASTGNADSMDHTRTQIRHAAASKVLATTLAKEIPGVKLTADENVPAGTTRLVIGSDFNGIGQAVTKQAAPETTGKAPARTAADSSCIN
ncbi:transcriptional attenuator, LytR family [Blastococcus aurantiacus]|uniref:Transcriptional attenuator, LytR family n=1 Tax=Blastococcus aurantiacus TaxID=1550231 RepID=A0A1G7KZV6_9ACTN|nr:transcriptional attenuator, LytR family [Blastococcus aurantiacus]